MSKKQRFKGLGRVKELYVKLNTNDRILFIDHLLSSEKFAGVFTSNPPLKQDFLELREELNQRPLKEAA